MRSVRVGRSAWLSVAGKTRSGRTTTRARIARGALRGMKELEAKTLSK